MSETVLGNGVRVLSERVASVRSVSVGVWVRHGAAHDAARVAGASHLLEHMVFKGTRKRTAREIALSLEVLGGSLDAYTTREHTGFQARVLDEHLPLALDVLADLTLQPLLRADDLDLEREVVLEEIAEVEDTPDDLVFELHGEALWPESPFGRSILGTPGTVGEMDVEVLRGLHERAYRGANMLIAAAGSVEHGAFVEAADRLFGGVDAGARELPVALPGAAHSGDRRVARSTAQSHIVIGTALPGHPDPARYPLALLSSALGGGMSSRLFQRIREEMGLCYTVFTHQTFYAGCGTGGVYLGTRPATEDRAVGAVREELLRVASEGLPPEELAGAKQQVKGQILLSMESTGARLGRLTSFALNDEPWMGLDEVLARVDAVTREQIHEVADRYFHPDRQLVLKLGPV